MEDKLQDPTASPQQTGGVMDVQPPQGGQMPAATPGAPPPASSAPEPVTPAPAPSATPDNSGLSPDLLAQAQKETTPQTDPSADTHAKPPKTPGKKGHKAVILVAVAVALILSGAAVFAYMASQKDKTDDHTADQPHTETTQPAEQAKPATATDVEDMAKELDDTVSSKDEAEDLPDGGLNESATGL